MDEQRRRIGELEGERRALQEAVEGARTAHSNILEENLKKEEEHKRMEARVMEVCEQVLKPLPYCRAFNFCPLSREWFTVAKSIYILLKLWSP